LSVVEDYRGGLHDRYFPVDCAQYLDNLPDAFTKKPKVRRAQTTDPLATIERWPNRPLLRLHSGRTPHATPRPLGYHRKGHHLTSLPRRSRRAGTTFRQEVVTPQVHVQTLDPYSSLQGAGAIRTQTALSTDKDGNLSPLVNNAIPLVTPGLKSTRTDLRRSCFVFDGTVQSGVEDQLAEEDTFYVAYSGARPKTSDVERLLKNAVNPPGLLTPQVTSIASVEQLAKVTMNAFSTAVVQDHDIVYM